MKTFHDSTGRAWTVALNVGVLKRVRSLCNVDLMAAVEGKLVERLVSDPVLLCDVLYAVCQEEAEARNVSDEDFGRLLAGDVIDAATTALLEELVDFFPKRRREVLRTALSKLETLQEKSVKAAMVFLESPELDRRLDVALAQTLGVKQTPERGEQAENTEAGLDATMSTRTPGGGSPGSSQAASA